MEGYSMPFPDLGDPRVKACLRLTEAYRSLATSFIGSWCQGIPTCTRGSLTKFTLEIFSRRFRSHPIVKELLSPPGSPDARRRAGNLPIGYAPKLVFHPQERATPASNARTSFPSQQTRTAPHTYHGEVETIGLEPTTSWLQTRCSTS